MSPRKNDEFSFLAIASRPLIGGPRRGLRRRVRTGLGMLFIVVAFSTSIHSSTAADDPAVLRAALRKGADRLLDLQHEDGSWPEKMTGKGSLRRSGRPGRALVAAHVATGEPRYANAAHHMARSLLEMDARGERSWECVSTMLFLAELGIATEEKKYTDLAERAWQLHLDTIGRNPQAAARRLIALPKMAGALGADYTNYMLWQGAERAELARLLGHEEWAEAFVVELASEAVPKHDDDWWTIAAGSLLEVLARCPGTDARRLASVQSGLITNNEVLPAIPWNDTPYDTAAFTFSSATALRGMAVAPDADARIRAQAGLLILARTQASHGGWGATLSFLGFEAEPGSKHWVAPIEAAAGETPDLNAQVMLALARGLQAAPRARDLPPSS